MVTKLTDISKIIRASGVNVERPIVVQETDETYPIKPDIEDNWILFQYLADLRLARQQKVKSAAFVGTGGGSDAIGAIYIFGNDLETIAITDTRKSVLEISRENVARYAGNRTLLTFTGSLCEPFGEDDLFDLIHENLPNIQDGGDLDTGIRQASFYDPEQVSHVRITDQRVKDYLLELHYTFLVEAKRRLNPDGSAICSIGGRFPIEFLREMVELLGYGYEELAGYKVQSEQDEVLKGFVRTEGGRKSDFYMHKEAVRFLKDRLAMKPPYIGLAGQELKESLRPFLISGEEAYREYQKNPDFVVGHTVHMVRAIKQ